MSDFIDDFLEGLEKDKTQPHKVGGLKKILMSSRDNQGTIVFAPFMDTVTKKFYVAINKVREYKTTMSKYSDGNDPVWVKILPKEFYSNITEAQSKLYDEVINLFDQLDEDLGDTANKWSMIRRRDYSLFQGMVTNHLDVSGNKNAEDIGKPAMIIFPSKQPINELANAIKTKMAGMNNSKEWIPAVFSPTASGREGVLSITFTKPDKPGYDCNVGFEFNSSYAKVIDPVAGFPEESVKEFGDLVSQFLGWQNGESSKFNEINFNELKKVLTVRINELQVRSNKAPEVPVNNKNGVDPMLNTNPITESAPPVEAPTSEPADEGMPELPF